jgi:hypothetical protein
LIKDWSWPDKCRELGGFGKALRHGINRLTKVDGVTYTWFMSIVGLVLFSVGGTSAWG